MISLLFVALLVCSVVKAFVSGPSRLARATARAKEAMTELEMALDESNAFNSKLLPDFSEEELKEMFKEFNITSFDFVNDPGKYIEIVTIVLTD